MTLATIVPFPQHFVGNLPPILLSWMNLLNLALLPHMFRGGWSVLRRPAYKKCLLLVLVPVVILLILGAAHVGVARYRETIAPIMLILAAVGVRQRPNVPFNALVQGLLPLMASVSYFARFF